MTDANLPNPSLVTTLVGAVRQTNATGAEWLTAQFDAQTSSAVATAFSWAGRKAGRARVQVDVTGLPAPASGWDTSTCARLALLLTFAQSHPPSEQHRLISDLFYRGDTAERCAILRCLPLLAEPLQYLLIATDSVRSHVEPVLEAIACENPYPARHFDDTAFNQLVMKVYFTGLDAKRIVGLQDRKNAELVRMATDFSAERKAAGRPVPSDLSLVTESS